MKTKNYVPLAALVLTLSAFAVGSPAHAEANAPTAVTQGERQGEGRGEMMGRGRMMGEKMMRPGVHGTVTAVSGNTITVSSTDPKTKAVTTYTIDATSAKITKDGAAGTIASIAVGDTIMADGTLTGTNLAAKMIFDGKMMGPRDGMMGEGKELEGLAGNGQPLVGGAVTAVSGSTITITNKSGVTYTVDATSAKFTKRDVTTPTIANITVGDTVLVQGTINGTAVTATTVLDQGAAPAAGTNQPPVNGTPGAKPVARGFFGAIGGFFSKLFGF